MTRQSIGSDTPEEKIDADRDGAPDRAEQDFAEDGQVQPGPSDATADHGRTDRRQGGGGQGDVAPGDLDDGGLESTRPASDTVIPPRSN